ncbi:hypothetical protein [Cellulosilyticum ruminicola]|uniref:hypothetical protein n=1 Tax=Cellulosilyticum ruminicola TaxID=425254 RepID=UPI0006D28C5E|nr:hypothetical protein [Cellulosilyticum ruminicola]
MKRRWWLFGSSVVLACILTFIPVMISRYSHCISSTSVTEQYNIKKGQDIIESYGYDMKEDCEGVSLNVKLKLIEGQVRFVLRNPDGKIEWEDTIDSGIDFNETKSFDKNVGYWTLEFENINRLAEGELALEFKKK